MTRLLDAITELEGSDDDLLWLEQQYRNETVSFVQAFNFISHSEKEKHKALQAMRWYKVWLIRIKEDQYGEAAAMRALDELKKASSGEWAERVMKRDIPLDFAEE